MVAVILGRSSWLAVAVLPLLVAAVAVLGKPIWHN